MNKTNIIALTDKQVSEAKKAIKEYERTARNYLRKSEQAMGQSAWQNTIQTLTEIYTKLSNPQKIEQ